MNENKNKFKDNAIFHLTTGKELKFLPNSLTTQHYNFVIKMSPKRADLENLSMYKGKKKNKKILQYSKLLLKPESPTEPQQKYLNDANKIHSFQIVHTHTYSTRHLSS